MVKTILMVVIPIAVVCGMVMFGWPLMASLNQADADFRPHHRADPANIKKITVTGPTTQPSVPYPWLADYSPENSLAARIAPPVGYEREPLEADKGFAYWLRNLPLKPGKPANPAYIADVDISLTSAELQSGPAAILRLYAENRFYRNPNAVKFAYSAKDDIEFAKWAEGFRPTFQADEITWGRPARRVPADLTYANFREFLNAMLPYASLGNHVDKANGPKNMSIANVFYQEGNPGKAVLVVDMAKSGSRKAFLLLQADADGMHILKNSTPREAGITPWYDVYSAGLSRPICTAAGPLPFKATDFKHFVADKLHRPAR